MPNEFWTRTYDSELQGNWRTRWLSSIEEFANLDDQKRLWLDPVGTNPHYSFREYFNCYFDDLDLNEGYDSAMREGFVSTEEATAVAEFHELADKYQEPRGDVYDHAAILNDPNWIEVVEAAKRAQVALSKIIDDPFERRLLLEP